MASIAAWPTAWHGQNLRDILVSLGYDVDTPWRDLPKKDRDWILFTEEAPTVPVYAGLTPEQTRTALTEWGFSTEEIDARASAGRIEEDMK